MAGLRTAGLDLDKIATRCAPQSGMIACNKIVGGGSGCQDNRPIE